MKILLIVLLILYIVWRIAKWLFKPILNWIYYYLLLGPLMKIGASKTTAKAIISVAIIILIVILVQMY